MFSESSGKIGYRDSTIVREFKQAVEAAYPDSEVIFYGSRVRGEGTESSDLDLLVVVKGEVCAEHEARIYDLGYDLELKYGVVLGILVQTRQFWDSDLGRSTPLRWNIDREGIKV